MELSEKVRENRLRATAKRRGMMLTRSRLRDPKAVGFGGYMLIDAATNAVVAGGDPFPFCFTLDDVDSWLNG